MLFDGRLPGTLFCTQLKTPRFCDRLLCLKLSVRCAVQLLFLFFILKFRSSRDDFKKFRQRLAYHRQCFGLSDRPGL